MSCPLWGGCEAPACDSPSQGPCHQSWSTGLRAGLGHVARSPGPLPLPQSTQKAGPPWGWARPSQGLDLALVLVTQMSWANLRTAFPALSPAQLHRLLTQYQLASAMGPMSAWDPVAQDRADAFKSGEHRPWAGPRGPVGRAGGRESLLGRPSLEGSAQHLAPPPWSVLLLGYPALSTPGGLHSWKSVSPQSMPKFQASGAGQRSAPPLMEPEEGASLEARPTRKRAGSPRWVPAPALPVRSTRAIYVHTCTHTHCTYGCVRTHACPFYRSDSHLFISIMITKPEMKGW